MKEHYNPDLTRFNLQTTFKTDSVPSEVLGEVLPAQPQKLCSEMMPVGEFSVSNVKIFFSLLKKLYKTLSEVKLEVETVIKTGRHIVQKQQTDNPKGMDEQLTSLKVLYNDLGAQVRHCAPSLSLSLFLSLPLPIFINLSNLIFACTTNVYS